MPTRKKGGKPGKPGFVRTKKTVTINGQEYSVTEAARIVGISRNAMHQRLFKLGWTDEEATVKEKRPSPPRKSKLFLTIKTPDGPVKKSAKQWSEEMEGDPASNLNLICLRKWRGWSDAQALGVVPPPPSKTRKATSTKKLRTLPKGPDDEQD